MYMNLYNNHMNTVQRNIINDITNNLNKTVTDISPIVGNGSVNHIFIVTTNIDKFVVRMNDDRGLDEFIKENWCIEQTRTKGIPGPEVITLGESHGYSYMALSFLEGIIGSQAANKLALWATLGTYAKKIHTIPVSGSGLDSSAFIDTNTNTSQEQWEKFVRYNIESLTPNDALLQLEALDNHQSKRVKQLFETVLDK